MCSCVFTCVHTPEWVALILSCRSGAPAAPLEGLEVWVLGSGLPGSTQSRGAVRAGQGASGGLGRPALADLLGLEFRDCWRRCAVQPSGLGLSAAPQGRLTKGAGWPSGPCRAAGLLPLSRPATLPSMGTPPRGGGPVAQESVAGSGPRQRAQVTFTALLGLLWTAPVLRGPTRPSRRGSAWGVFALGAS